ncbi:MAG: hypothetical protein M1817_000448 [Caeruleum heppii]|nr:MAG: hypothetical protein M1817_000448 [Caeruleum heppii]
MQGFNMGRYVPPEHEGTVSANKLAGKHALGSRARKAGQGILTVRFEMPFAIWCTTCPKPTIIGQGVRFNAEKKKVDAYYSTPIYSFRMKHTACGGTIEIRTDPKNTAYVVTEGARKRDVGEDKVKDGDWEIRTEEERERIRSDAFAALEDKVEDKRKLVGEASRLQDLRRFSEKRWKDPYQESRRLRRVFREERKVREKKDEATEALREKMGLGIELLDETNEDVRRAGFVDFGTVDADTAIVKATSRPLFAVPNFASKTHIPPRPSKADKSRKRKPDKSTLAKSEAERHTRLLTAELRSNTLAAVDPFLNTPDPNVGSFAGLKAGGRIPGVKRRKPPEETTIQVEDPGTAKLDAPEPSTTSNPPTALVPYDSD